MVEVKCAHNYQKAMPLTVNRQRNTVRICKNAHTIGFQAKISLADYRQQSASMTIVFCIHITSCYTLWLYHHVQYVFSAFCFYPFFKIFLHLWLSKISATWELENGTDSELM